MAQSDCEPDSQNDGNDVDFGNPNELLEEIEAFESLNSSSGVNVSQEESSVLSQVSINSQQSVFKKYPALNRNFQKETNGSATCMACQINLKTRKMSRVKSHIKKCNALTPKDRLELMTTCDVETHAKVESRSKHQ